MENEARSEQNQDAQKPTSVLLYKDDLCVILRDKRSDRCTAHYQCVPKRHICDFTHLKLKNDDVDYGAGAGAGADSSDDSRRCPDLVLLEHMERVGK